MPIISAEGNLLSPLYIVHQEHTKDGYFGTNIKKHLLKFLKNKINILVSSSKSGKMEKKHYEEWLQKCYFPHVPKQSMLLLDSWTTYNDNSTLTKVIPEGTTIDVLRIPKHTTSLVQPCDVFL